MFGTRNDSMFEIPTDHLQPIAKKPASIYVPY